jgi:hypothetical protein
LKIIEIGYNLPKAAFGYLNLKFSAIISKELGAENKKFQKKKNEDDDTK